MALYEKYSFWDEGQSLFDTTIRGLWWFMKLALKLLVYFPLVFVGYIVAAKFLDKQTNGIFWIATILSIVFVIYLLIYFIKGIILGLKFHRNVLWIPLLLIAVSFTCILPVWLTWNETGKIILDMGGNKTLQWLFAIAFATYIYYRYNFLINTAPLLAFPACDAGIRFTAMLLNKTFFLTRAKSKEMI
jgi:hypothetical protein